MTVAPRVGLIWAQAEGRVIGRDGGMPWHVPEDLAHFKEVTNGHPVIMGRATWESIDPRYRPLPGRRNIVVTRNPGWTAEGAEVAGSLDDALRLVAGEDAVVMGGGQIYAQAMPHATRLLVTEVDLDLGDGAGDAVAPAFGPEWTVTDPGAWQQSRNGITFRWVGYARS